MFDFSMLRSNTDNGLGTDRLSRHIAIFFQHLSAAFLFLSRKKRHIDEESFDTYADLNHGTEVCIGKRGANSEISRPYPRHFQSTVSQEQFYPACQSRVLCHLVMCVLIDPNTLQQCGKLYEFTTL